MPPYNVTIAKTQEAIPSPKVHKFLILAFVSVTGILNLNSK